MSASLYSFTSPSDERLSLYCDAKYASEPKSLYEYASPISAPPVAMRKCSPVTEVEFVAPPPPYQPKPESSPSASKWSLWTWLFTPREVSPPPYVSEEEIALIEARLKAMDTFFGGAALY